MIADNDQRENLSLTLHLRLGICSKIEANDLVGPQDPYA
jgi:hypothetical protein